MAPPKTRRRGPWRRAGFGFVLPILGLLAVSFFAYAWANNLMDALADFRSPGHEPLPASQPLTPLTDGLVLVMVDGLRYDTSTEMPFLNELAQRGAEVTVMGQAPSYSQNAWTTLITGASPQISGAPPLNVDDIERIEPISAGDLFTSASGQGLSAAVYGYYWWERMIPEAYRDDEAFTPGEDDAADLDILTPALAQLESGPADFTLIHLDQVDHAGHLAGGKSPLYREAALRVDDYLREIVGRLDLERQTLVVLADHGHRNRGGHGGQEQNVLTTRLVALGQGIRPGQYDEIQQVDVAPTLAALMGVAIPERNEGRPAEGMLAWTDAQQAETWYALASQRLALTNAHLSGIGDSRPGPDAGDRLTEIAGLLEQEAWEPARQAAEDLVAALDSEVASARQERAAHERRTRIWMPAAYLVILGIVFWRNRRRGGRFPIGPALAAIAVYHLLFLVTGNTYSLSTITGLPPFVLGMTGRSLAGLLVGWIWLLLLRPAVSRASRVEETLGYGWLVIALQGVLVSFMVWWIGPTISWMLPDFAIQFVLFTTLLQVVFIGAGTLLLAGVDAVAPRPRGVKESRNRHTLHA